jgi:mRNA interferase MazF
MTNYQPGDIVLVTFPYVGGRGGKVRPGLVVADTGDADIVVARITTQAIFCPQDIPISDWQGAGLLGASVVRVHKLATVEKVLVQRVVGQLTAADRQTVGAALHQLFAGW